MKTNKNPILESLRTVHEKYPTEPIQLWIRQKGEAIEYSYDVGEHPNRVYGAWRSDAGSAAVNLIEKAGDRDPKEQLLARIQRLRKELLQAEEEARR